MDMICDDADTLALGYQGDAGFGMLEANIYRHRIEHLMDNYSLRPADISRMFAPATSGDSGAGLATSIARLDASGNPVCSTPTSDAPTSTAWTDAGATGGARHSACAAR
jgi:hypothetical protein